MVRTKPTMRRGGQRDAACHVVHGLTGWYAGDSEVQLVGIAEVYKGLRERCSLFHQWYRHMVVQPVEI